MNTMTLKKNGLIIWKVLKGNWRDLREKNQQARNEALRQAESATNQHLERIKDLRDQEIENEQDRLDAIAELNEDHQDRLTEIERDGIRAREDLQRELTRDARDVQADFEQSVRELFADEELTNRDFQQFILGFEQSDIRSRLSSTGQQQLRELEQGRREELQSLGREQELALEDLGIREGRAREDLGRRTRDRRQEIVYEAEQNALALRDVLIPLLRPDLETETGISPETTVDDLTQTGGTGVSQPAAIADPIEGPDRNAASAG